MTSSVSRVNPDRSTRREARLLDAAARLFARFGFDKTSIDDIAREAGVSKGAVYLHWPSKDALFGATLEREGLRLEANIRDRIEADPAGGTLAAIYRHSIVALEANPLLFAALTFDARVLGDYVRRQDPSISRQRLAFGQEFVCRMQAAELMRADLDPEVTAYIMTVISFGLLGVRQLAPHIPSPSMERLADALADLVDRGLAAHGDAAVSSEAGKDAFGSLADATISLYTEPAEAARGSHTHHPSAQS